MAKVLIAEDDPGTRRILTKILASDGYEVIETADGGSAYLMAVSERPDLILLDVMMPVMDGFDVLRRLRKNPDTEATNVVLLTGVSAETGELKAMKLGVKHYITKSMGLDPETVRLVVKIALTEQVGVETIGRSVGSTEAIKTLHDMLDEKLGGGIPVGSLTLIEGGSSAGKSVLCQHLSYGSLLNGYGVAYFTFEETAKSLITQMASIGLNVWEHFQASSLRIYPMEEPDESEPPERSMAFLTREMNRLPTQCKTVVVDAVTNLLVYGEHRAIVSFFTFCKRQCQSGENNYSGGPRRCL